MLRSLVIRFGIYVAVFYFLLLVAGILFVSVFQNSPENIIRNLKAILNLKFLLAWVLIPFIMYALGTASKFIRLESAFKHRKDRTGIHFAAAYIFLVTVVYMFTACTTKPDNVGYDWIPFIMLAMPWYSFNASLLYPD